MGSMENEVEEITEHPVEQADHAVKYTPLHLRILKALSQFDNGRARYDLLMYKVWPSDKFPRAYRNSSNGGPPGVAWVFGRALREMREKSLIYRPNERDDKFGQHDVSILSAGRKAMEIEIHG